MIAGLGGQSDRTRSGFTLPLADEQIALSYRRSAALSQPFKRGDCARTADAARGAATIRGGWRGSRTLSCQAKTIVDEAVSAKSSLATLSTPTTCKLRAPTTSAAFCAAHRNALRPASLMERGREQPPAFATCPVPRTARGVAHAPVSVSRSLANVRAICAPFARALSPAYTLQIARGSHCTFDTHSSMVTRAHRPSQRPASSGARHRQGSPLRSDPLRGPAGLDDACAQLEGSTHVMAEEALVAFSILTGAAGRRMVKISSVPLRTLSAVASDAERCSRRPQGNAAAPSQPTDRSRGSPARAITASDLTSRVLLSASRRHPRSSDIERAGSSRRARGAIQHNTNRHASTFAGSAYGVRRSCG